MWKRKVAHSTDHLDYSSTRAEHWQLTWVLCISHTFGQLLYSSIVASLHLFPFELSTL